MASNGFYIYGCFTFTAWLPGCVLVEVKSGALNRNPRLGLVGGKAHIKMVELHPKTLNQVIEVFEDWARIFKQRQNRLAA